MDCYSPEGAKKLARAIERKWKGSPVKVWIEVREDIEGSPRFVKTNLVNGLPATYQHLDFGYLP